MMTNVQQRMEDAVKSVSTGQVHSNVDVKMDTSCIKMERLVSVR